MKFLIFEGADRVGKTTLIHEFQKLTNYKYLIADRLFVSQLVYEKLFNRIISLKDYTELYTNMLKLKNFMIFVHVDCSEEKLKQRILSDKTHKNQLQEILQAKKLFTETFEQFKETFEIIHIDTTKTSSEQLAKELLNKLESR